MEGVVGGVCADGFTADIEGEEDGGRRKCHFVSCKADELKLWMSRYKLAIESVSSFRWHFGVVSQITRNVRG